MRVPTVDVASEFVERTCFGAGRHSLKTLNPCEPMKLETPKPSILQAPESDVRSAQDLVSGRSCRSAPASGYPGSGVGLVVI